MSKKAPKKTPAKEKKRETFVLPDYFESPESSSIMRADYDRVNSILFVAFKHGKRYSHEKFPVEGWAKFVKAESKGRHYNEFIRDHYTSAQV